MIYITDAGLEKNSLEENLAYVHTVIQGEKGPDVDLNPSGPWGQIAAMLAKVITDIDDQQEEIYISRDPDSASGVSLDKLAAETGTIRQEATATVVQSVLLLGDEGTTILAEKQVTQAAEYDPPADLYFTLNSDVLISRSYARKVVFTLTDPAEGTVYSLTINSVIYSYTALAEDTVTSVITAVIALLPDEVAGSNVDDQLVLYGDDLDFTINSNASFTLDELWAAGDFTASIVGANVVPVGSLTEIVTPVTGWDAVDNPNAGITGDERETDTALNIRRKSELIKGKATDGAIKNAVANVDNVSSATVVSNRTAGTVDNIPAKSFETIVTGGLPDDIAQAIQDNMPSGISPYGLGYEGNAVNEEGETVVIPFSRTTATYIWVRYTRTQHPEEEFPANGNATIKQNLLDWVEDNISTGTDVVRQRLETPFFEVPGSQSVVTEFAQTENPEDTPTWTTDALISIAAREIAQFDEDRIFVVLAT